MNCDTAKSRVSSPQAGIAGCEAEPRACWTVAIGACGAAAWGCGKPATPRPSTRKPRQRAKAGLVAPLADDPGDDIRSWVDGQVVTDWPAEIARRERAIQGYLNDDRRRAGRQKYGFRSGQHPRLAWSWFRDNPVGFNGVPFVLFKTILDLDPESREPDAAPDRAHLEARGRRCRPAPGPRPRAGRSITSASARTRPTTSTASRARPASGGRRCPSASPSRTRARSSRCRRPRRRSTTGGCWRGACSSNTSLLLAKMRATEHEDNWERDRPGFGSPGSMDRVFFSCAACHVGRVVVDGKMKFLPGMPNTEIEAQYFSKLLMLTAAALVESGFDPQSTTPVNPANIKPNTGAVRALYTEMLDKARQRPETLYGSSPADIARAQDPGAGHRRRVPQRDAGSDRRRREDALHLLRRGEEQRLQAAAARRPRGSAGPDGRVRHRVGAGGDSHAPPRQQLPGVRAPRQPEEPDLHRLLQGQRPAGRRARHDRAR